MLIRIVRMTFKEDQVTDFLDLFESVRDKISNMEGCVHLELLPDFHKPNILSTYSVWLEDVYLQNYRKSALFEEVWSKTKIYFSDKPIAFSLKKDTPFEYDF